MTQIAFARQSAGAPEHREYSGERLVNCYAQPQPDGGTGPFIVAWAPGLTPLATLSAGDPVRAVYHSRGVVYAACGGSFWRLNGATATRIGDMQDDPQTYIDGNGDEIVALSAGVYRVYNVASGAFEVVAPGALAAARTLTGIDGYIVLSEQDGQRIQASRPLSAKQMDGLDFASAEADPDGIVRVHADHSELWLFGSAVTEVWTNTGAADFPFARISGGVIERGCRYPMAVASDDNTVYWVGDDGLVYRAAGYTPSVISTPYVSAILRGYADTAEIAGMAYSWRGAKHYVIRLPDAPALVYDAASTLWHERSTGPNQGAWQGQCAARRGADVIVGARDGRLHALGGLTDGGETILREGVSLPVQGARERITVDDVQLQFRTGATDISRAARVMLQHSRDGRTWGPEIWRSLGEIGQYDRLIRWNGFGRARQHQFRWRISDPIDGALYGATARTR